jgi:replicative DNA helicase
MNEDLFDKKEGIAEKRARIRRAKAEAPRRIQLLCLKNRYGIANFSCNFKYYPKYDLFVPDMTREFDEQTGGKSSRQRR